MNEVLREQAIIKLRLFSDQNRNILEIKIYHNDDFEETERIDINKFNLWEFLKKIKDLIGEYND